MLAGGERGMIAFLFLTGWVTAVCVDVVMFLLLFVGFLGMLSGRSKLVIIGGLSLIIYLSVNIMYLPAAFTWAERNYHYLLGS